MGSLHANSRGGREWRWQVERAEIGSRWAWLQVRLAELGSQIQMLDNIHRRIVSSKVGAQNNANLRQIRPRMGSFSPFLVKNNFHKHCS